ncbi:MAG: Kae1-associated serine/threonine protein kinase [Candidatus Marsarchaeota archaeon]|jgi:TP53 regulating kinase-like protein|nr:Kae1-associated serine/threonine protein kinase [Candidatus Marsarchaeota archaeon]MCL5418791.1 Kae1-associated serine/threonine protein kinase [Candidatus Marsarchaeota archaeon]
MAMKMISEGAEARIYAAMIFGINAILKYRQPKRYRIRALDEAIRVRRTRIEARALITAQGLGVKVPQIVLVGRFGIFTTRINGRTLADILGDNGAKAPMKALADSGRYLAMLHSHNIAHGDFTPANIMVSNNDAKDTYIIDFGLSSFTASAEDKALDLLLMKRSLSYRDFKVFASSYKAHCDGSDAVLERLRDIERRGRYQTRTLAV